MTTPNFLILGAAKSGTTSLYYYLRQHPDIYMCRMKEPHFFSFEGETLTFRRPENQPDPLNQSAVTDWESYCALFDGATTEQRIGEASPSYLHTPKAANGIKARIPGAKLIAILRHPAERAYSGFLGQYLKGIENGTPYLTDFEAALQSEAQFERENWTPVFLYKKLGFYYEQLKYYYDLFNPEQIHVCLNHDMKTQPIETLQSIFRFLEIDDHFVPNTSVRAGASGVPKNPLLYRFLKSNAVKSVFKPLVPKGFGQKFEKAMLNKPTLSAETRQSLIALYRDDILKLQDLIHRDLSAWLQ